MGVLVGDTTSTVLQVFVGNLAFGTKDADLKEAFSKAGEVYVLLATLPVVVSCRHSDLRPPCADPLKLSIPFN